MGEFRLRKLELKDASFMLEWMKDPDISRFFRFDAASMTEASCITYILNNRDSATSRHYAIVDEADEYLGTISLKNIDDEQGEAEYAISTRNKAHGTGAALWATKEILRIAFTELKLQKVFLNVMADNKRANAFYRKAGFKYLYTQEDGLLVRGVNYSLNWYEILKSDYYEETYARKL